MEIAWETPANPRDYIFRKGRRYVRPYYFEFISHIEGGLLQKEYVAKVVGVLPEGEQVVNANVNYDAGEGRSSIEVDEEFTGQPLRGKVACTKFMRICTDGKHSVVLCKPVTGRTHQVVASRSTFATGVDRAASVSTDVPPPTLRDSVDNGHCTDAGNVHSDDEFSIDPMCTNCPDLAPKGYDGDEEGLWLHCVRYRGPDWSYECPCPDRAFLE